MASASSMGLLLVQMKALEPSTRVLVLGTSSEPQMCVKKDEKAFLSFFDKHIYMPLPDYASRLVRWPLGWRVQPSFCSPLQHTACSILALPAAGRSAFQQARPQ